MYSSLHKFILGVAVTLFTFLTDAFNPSANTNLAVYWGQGPNQKRLAHFCEDSDIDIISIAFVNLFPDQDHGGYPGTNFGNQCGSETYNNTDGTPSPLLSNCPTIGPDISYCQAVGKKILLSLGGAYPTNYELNNDESAVEFATFLWGAFGPKKEEWTGPRPFGEASVDGFDLDIESVITPEPADLSYQYRGYATMIDTLRGFYALEDVKEYYISGAPQCIVPDAHLANAIENSWFDFLFVQFYNTPQCSARAFFNHTYGAYGGPSTDISFDSWVHFVQRSSKNSEAKVYLGLPAAPNVTYDAPMYIEPTEAQILIQTFQCKYPNIFGGVMVYEATYSEDYPVDGKSYADEVKGLLENCKCGSNSSTTSSSSSTSSFSLISSTLSVSLPTLSTSSTPSKPSSASPSPTSTSSLSSRATLKPSTIGVSNSSSRYTIAPSNVSVSASIPTFSYSSTVGLNLSTSTGIPLSLSTSQSLAPVTILPYSSYSKYNVSSPTSSGQRPSISASFSPYSNLSSDSAGPTSTSSRFSMSVSISPYSTMSSFSARPTSVSSQTVLSRPLLSAPYSTSNSSAALGPTASATSETSFTTEYSTIVISTCASTVLNCPARSTTVVTSIFPIPTTVSPSSSGSSKSSIPNSHLSSSYTNSPTASTGLSLSSGSSDVSESSDLLGSSDANSPTTANFASVSSQSATIQEILTTEIILTTVTTCPVTNTLTSGSSQFVQTTWSVSTIYETTFSTICTKCDIPKPSSLNSGLTAILITIPTSTAPSSSLVVPTLGASAQSLSSFSPLILSSSTTISASIKSQSSSFGANPTESQESYQPTLSSLSSSAASAYEATAVSTAQQAASTTSSETLPATPSTAGESPSSASEATPSSSTPVTTTYVTSTTHLTLTIPTTAPPSSISSVSVISSSTASVITRTVVPIPLNSTQTMSHSSTFQTPFSDTVSSSSNSTQPTTIVTMTLIPIPVSSYHAAVLSDMASASASSASSAADDALQASSSATTGATSSSSSTVASSVSSSAGASSTQGTMQQFTGAASQAGETGVVGLVIVMAAILLVI